jgi:CheY-like chemotaxis protein
MLTAKRLQTGHIQDMPAPASFASLVRHALAHLYDPDVLRTHPLLAMLGLSTRANPQAALRDLLLSAIEAMRPPAAVPVSSRAWRVYKVLQCRYVQQMDQEQTANQLGVGVRHVRREQHAAVEALADVLHQKYAPATAAPPDAGDAVSQLGSELSWLKDAGQDENLTVGDVLSAALRLAAPLATARAVALEAPDAPPLLLAAIHATALRQALVSATTFAIRKAPGGVVRFTALAEGDHILLDISARAGGEALPAAAGDEAASLQAASAIIHMAGGSLDVVEERSSLDITIRLAAAGVVDVLLVDDNADFAQLFARYVAGTRYRLQCAQASGLFDLLSAGRPRVIVLDVMMPDLDGWEILGRLRQHPLTSGIPVIVCTVLPERDLAIALGARGFLPKPVTRQALLEALERALGATPPESR